MINVYQRAEALAGYITDIRRRIHANPEVGFCEHETTALIAKELDAFGIPYQTMSPTGILAEIRGEKPGAARTVLLRADMDALPIQEKTGLPFASQNAGVSHACGHDTHTAMLLGAARLINENKSAFPGSVRLLFQPAEETGQGASKMIEQSVLENVSACFAVHVISMLPAGTVFTAPGQMMAGAGTFTIKVEGVTGHGASPELGRDALLAGAEIVAALQSIASREVAATTPFTLTVGTFHAGDRYNIVAGHAVLEGTVRAFDRTLLADAGTRIRRIASGVAEACRCKAETEYAMTCESLITDPDVTDILRGAAKKVLRDEKLLLPAMPHMGSEDFAYISAKAPCAFAALGAGGVHPQHSEYYTIDESVFPLGAALYAQFAEDALNRDI